MQNLATSMFNTVALEPTYDAQPGPNVPLQGGSATGVMQPMKRTTILFHTLFKVACLPADAGRESHSTLQPCWPHTRRRFWPSSCTSSRRGSSVTKGASRSHNPCPTHTRLTI